MVKTEIIIEDIFYLDQEVTSNIEDILAYFRI